MRLIDLERLQIGLKNPEVFEDKYYAKGWNDAIRCIMMEPIVDAVEVVRCKDCKNYSLYKCKMVGTVREYDYCCFGVRKDDSSKD